MSNTRPLWNLSGRRAPRWLITFALATHDIVMAAIAMEMAFALRYSFSVPPLQGYEGVPPTFLFAGVAAIVFAFSGLHRGIWRYTALSNFIAIVKAAIVTVLLFLPVLFFFTRLELFPRSVVVIVWPCLIILLAAPRFLFRLWTSGSFSSLVTREDPNRIPVLIAGVSEEADRFIRETQVDSKARFVVVGLLDPQPDRRGRDVRGVRVLGTPADVETIFHDLTVRSRRPQRIVLSPLALQGAAVRQLLDAAERLGTSLSRLPRATELAHTPGGTPALQPIDMSDLLGRPQTRLDRDAMRAFVAGKRVLVTGAGGTIGSELCRQIAALAPQGLTLVDQGEFALYQIELELAETELGSLCRAVLGDVRDRAQITRIIAEAKPNIVFHAAALKHVPLVEANICEGMLTNIAGTQNVADAALAAGVSEMVLISTDKAVHPTSVMGATKRAAELYCQALNVARRGTRFVTVRFGNVLGSTGSVVPLFQRQLARGGPLTVTHPDVKRYFMTTREAVELVIEAAALPAPGDDGAERIHVLDMGEAVLIADIAREMIRLAGLRPDIDIAIAYTGLRPGEKLEEQLFYEKEQLCPTPAEGILTASPRTVPLETLKPALDRLIAAARARDSVQAMQLLRTLVLDYGAESRVEITPLQARGAT